MAGILEGGVADGMLALGELMAQTQEEEEEQAAARPAAKAFTPADIGGAPAAAAGPGLGAPAAPAGDPKAIWTEDEVVEVPEDDVDDGRRAPAYDFRYKQAVGTEDAFLGMGEKDPSSTSCEDLVLVIDLPGTESMAELDLEVRATHVRLYTPRFKLSLPLPHKVLEDRGTAKWDGRKDQLVLSLPIVREDPW